MNVVVCVKYVPDAQSARGFNDTDSTTDRLGVEGRLSETDEYAVEEGLRRAGPDGGVVVVTVGPGPAVEAVRRALQMGAHRAVHVCDDDIHGSDALATSLVLAAAVRKAGGDALPDLVLMGMSSTDGVMGVVPAMVAERLGVPQVTFVSRLTIEGTRLIARRDSDTASDTIEANLPAVVSVTDQINEPRYPSFKDIMAAKRKPVDVWTLADLGIDRSSVGLGATRARVRSVVRRPPRGRATIVADEGQAGATLARFLTDGHFI
ncbi:electron transfer flavoprotein subunit beta/FixA family protein [Dactylosporangium salmoneum]|uniref:Electron transfer flavoprotein subunit beta n=1 Tax=Dactylosporangium salmoneum TaxID=53361 RepID=A0ABN3FXQ3_9ACTN